MIRNLPQSHMVSCLSALVVSLSFLSMPMQAQKDATGEHQLFHEAPLAARQSHEAALGREVERPGDATLVLLDFSVFESMRSADLDAFDLSLPLPKGRSTDSPEDMSFQLERFFVHPAVLTVGTTSERGFEEHEYVPQLQTFKMHFEGNPVGTLTFMQDHVLPIRDISRPFHDIIPRKDNLTQTP